MRNTTCVVLLTALVGCAGCDLDLADREQPQLERFELSDCPLPDLPRRPAGEFFAPNVLQYAVDLPVADGQPGHASHVRVLLPDPLPQGPLPALVFNGAGAYVFSGMTMADADFDALLPYVPHGFALVGYETDGCQKDFSHDPSPFEMRDMARDYAASKAGLINARNAIAFALERFPEIDPQQLYTIGHSSGAKQGLLLAIHDERIRGCVAFAPACRMEFRENMMLSQFTSGDKSICQDVNRSMPMVHAATTTTPLLLIHTRRDRVVKSAEVQAYANAVGDVADIREVDCPGHGYVPEEGFELSLAWLAKQMKASNAQSISHVSRSSVGAVVDNDMLAAQPATDQPQETAEPSVSRPPPQQLARPTKLPSPRRNRPLNSVQSNPFVTD